MSEFAEKWNRRYAARPLVWSVTPNAVVSEHVRGLTPGRAVDLGCGEGRNALWLAELGWEVVGVDFSNVGLEKGRQKAIQRDLSVDWIEADLGRHRLEPASVDLSLVCFLHTGATERGHWLKQAIGAVRAGGYFIYLGHDARNPTDGHGGPRDPEVLPLVSELIECLDEFDIERAETIERPIGDETGHGTSKPGAIALDSFVKARKR